MIDLLLLEYFDLFTEKAVTPQEVLRNMLIFLTSNYPAFSWNRFVIDYSSVKHATRLDSNGKEANFHVKPFFVEITGNKFLQNFDLKIHVYILRN